MFKTISRFVGSIYLFLLLWTFIMFARVIRIGLVLRRNGIVKKTGRRSVLYLAAFFPENAGYQYRVLKWAEILEESGYSVVIKTVFQKSKFEYLWHKNSIFLYTKPLIRRFFQVLSSYKYDRVIVRRELLLFNDYGNLFLEKLLLSIQPNAILDFDDDISAAKKEPKTISLFGRLLNENNQKFTSSLKLYDHFIAGSNYLREKVEKINSACKIVVIPTCVDYNKLSPRQYKNNGESIIFGWIGGNQNLSLIESLIPVLNRISKKNIIKLLIISGRSINVSTDFEIIFKKWSMDSQIENLQSIDIGLMPLKNNMISKGKCGFKLIQYMGLGIVSIASAVTVNNEIIDLGENGFLVYDENKWADTIQEVIDKRDQWGRIGKKAREKVLEHYTFDANKEKYLNFLRNE
jgi:glycosyltransferase involved in cell wall biosynthesis